MADTDTGEATVLYCIIYIIMLRSTTKYDIFLLICGIFCCV